ncbi:MAG: hypothetical protein M2R45_03762 [Verrucomicrobia subdivision 3 bacterium]|nr:hypothetical protein [Limisphaerales bacterium]
MRHNANFVLQIGCRKHQGALSDRQRHPLLPHASQGVGVDVISINPLEDTGGRPPDSPQLLQTTERLTVTTTAPVAASNHDRPKTAALRRLPPSIEMSTDHPFRQVGNEKLLMPSPPRRADALEQCPALPPRLAPVAPVIHPTAQFDVVLHQIPRLRSSRPQSPNARFPPQPSAPAAPTVHPSGPAASPRARASPTPGWPRSKCEATSTISPRGLGDPPGFRRPSLGG